MNTDIKIYTLFGNVPFNDIILAERIAVTKGLINFLYIFSDVFRIFIVLEILFWGNVMFPQKSSIVFNKFFFEKFFEWIYTYIDSLYFLFYVINQCAMPNAVMNSQCITESPSCLLYVFYIYFFCFNPVPIKNVCHY